MKKITVGADKEFQLLSDAVSAASDDDVIWMDAGTYDINVNLIIEKRLSFVVNNQTPLVNKCVWRLPISTASIIISPKINFLLFDCIFFECASSCTLLIGQISGGTYANPLFHLIFNCCSFNKDLYPTVLWYVTKSVPFGILDFNYCYFAGANTTTTVTGTDYIHGTQLNFYKSQFLNLTLANNISSTMNTLGHIWDIVSAPTNNYGPSYGVPADVKYDIVFQGEIRGTEGPLPTELLIFDKTTKQLVIRTKASYGGEFLVSYTENPSRTYFACSRFSTSSVLYGLQSDISISPLLDQSTIGFGLTDSTVLYVDLLIETHIKQIQLSTKYSDIINRLASIALSYSTDGVNYSTPEIIIFDYTDTKNWESAITEPLNINYEHTFRYLKIQKSGVAGRTYYLSDIICIPDVSYYGNLRSVVLNSLVSEKTLRPDHRYNSFYKESVLLDLPIGYWRFDEYAKVEGALDIAKNYPGVYNGNVKLNSKSNVSADTDPSVYLSVSSYVSITSISVSKPWSVEGFIRSSMINESTDSPLIFSGDSSVYFIYLRVSGRCLIFSTKSATEEWTLTSEPLLHKNRNNYFCVTVSENNEVILFFNGSPIIVGQCPFDITNGLSPIHFGRKETVYLDGYLDEFAWYSTCITTKQIYERYLTSQNSIFDIYKDKVQKLTPVQYWRLDEEFMTKAVNEASPIAADFLAFFKLNNTLEDESSSVFDALIYGDAIFHADRWGALNGSLLFNQSSAYLELPHDILLNRIVFSISLWFRTPGNGSYGQTLICGSRTGDLISLLLNIDSNGLVKLTFNTFTINGVGPDLRDNEWHNIVLTHSDSIPSTVLYVDGVNVGSSTATMGALFLNNHGLRVGGRPVTIVGGDNESNWNLVGAVDDIRMYGRVLNTPEIEDIVSDGVIQITGEYKGFINQGEDGALLYSPSKCPLFGGFNGRVEIHGMRLKNLGNFSLMFWVQTIESSRYVIYSEYSSDFQTAVIISMDSRIHIEFWNGGLLSQQIYSLSRINDNEWHLITITYDSLAIVISIDTHIERSKSLSIDQSAATTAYIGCKINTGSPSNGFVGKIDEFAYFDRILNNTEISNVFKASNREIPSVKSLYDAAIDGANSLLYMVAKDSQIFDANNNYLLTGYDINYVVNFVSNTSGQSISNQTGKIIFSPDNHFKSVGAFSIECWIVFHDINEFTTTEAPQIFDYYEQKGISGNRGYKFGRGKFSKNILEFVVGDTVLQIPNIQQDQEYHFVMIFDGQQIYGYVNNILVGQTLQANYFEPINISSINIISQLKCFFSQLSFYDYLLTPEEVSLHWEFGS